MKRRVGWGSVVVVLMLSVVITACSTAQSGDEEVNSLNDSGTHEEAIKDEHEGHWSYAGETGPTHWGSLDASYELCEQEQEQSPINIETDEVTTTDAHISIAYQPSSFEIENNGHTIQANALTEDNTISIEDEDYQLIQFHFHVPSEHQKNGEHLDMELHFVHQNQEGELAVLGVLMEEGDVNEALAELWAEMPQEEMDETIELTDAIDLNALLPSSHEGFHYGGSLTTPPCTEGVKWVVLEKTISVSQEQIDTFAEIFPTNNRPVQPWNDRHVYEVAID
ncbi:carbonic anhydrase [Salipaludibacillus agaradhaerens]|uniref:carbonic anhydrase n=1 Tax=Salipaludibacillus agaradhaerens TaxID=76935 RepID=A0A9Q4B521_SALAG|nr:carbonic anhydrase [Salipaludibacillus agaradhaerens]MCR6098110.1 carbonic anhydrase [Salipaludibacillus agaradhaerens]MCR6116260.1 carbonic anhydrase [Salipaludibacillus agaradhaerens]